MFHLALHFIVPAIVALQFFRQRWQMALLVMMATMLVDLDHLFADPIMTPVVAASVFTRCTNRGL